MLLVLFSENPFNYLLYVFILKKLLFIHSTKIFDLFIIYDCTSVPAVFPQSVCDGST